MNSCLENLNIESKRGCLKRYFCMSLRERSLKQSNFPLLWRENEGEVIEIIHFI